MVQLLLLPRRRCAEHVTNGQALPWGFPKYSCFAAFVVGKGISALRIEVLEASFVAGRTDFYCFVLEGRPPLPGRYFVVGFISEFGGYIVAIFS